MNYQAPGWLPGGHAQTIWPALMSRNSPAPALRFQRERWQTPDADFIDVDWLAEAPPKAPTDATPANITRPLLVLFHGLEGNTQSHSSQAFASMARARGWAFALPHFRGCSGELNLAPRAYHSGDFEEIDWMLKRFQARWKGPLIAAGVSLGGNALMRWAEESGSDAARSVHAVCSVCSPLDLAAAGRAIGEGFNRLVYTRMFLRSMVPKALEKLAQHPGLFDGERLRQAKNLYEFDNLFTAPLHGFRDTEDYWARASAKPHLRHIRVPALVLNARNDPFVPAHSLPTQTEVGSHVTLWQPAQGGHVGFPRGLPPGHVLDMPDQVCNWLATHLP
ncbi:YheT family hydrolase [Roseateles koreensis]|uniref:Alpha/beta hydrolase n=1 Tax=Roseateles koreensis TaxID=2987526 RepID=A0ABT5KPI6_9BURK|nr:alpha/beta fold hydrolase [Roseateles koreensis]MDC8784832.1 alpha/beta hydrolase [Roseateles koreensis]